MNRWGIPEWLELEVIARDRHCIYCRVEFASQSRSRSCKPSWEHIVNDASIITRENIAICCVSCNSSKGTKNLSNWLTSKYCETNGITRESIASVARAALESHSSSSHAGA